MPGVQLDFGNLKAIEANSIKVSLAYEPLRPIPFLSKSYPLLGGEVLKIKYLHPEIEKVDSSVFRFNLNESLWGISNYQLKRITISVNSHESDSANFYFISEVEHKTKPEALQNFWLMEREGGVFPGKVVKVTAINSGIVFNYDLAKNVEYEYLKKTSEGILELDEENRPILTDSALAELQKALWKEIESKE